MRPTRQVLALLLAIALLTGCWDRREINDIAVVVASAIDKEGDLYRTTVQFPLPSQLGGAGSGGGGGGTSGAGDAKTWYLDSATGPSIREVNGKQQRSLSRQQIFSHRRSLLIGEELARAGLEPVVDLLGRIPQNRMNANVFITHGPAYRALNVDAPIEQTSAEMAREMAIATMKSPQTLRSIVDAMLTEGKDLYIPVLATKRTPPGPSGKSQTTLALDGLAVFAQNRLVGYLGHNASLGVLWALGQQRRPTVSVPVPPGALRVSAEFHETHAEIRPQVSGDQIRIQIRVRAIGGLVENPTNVTWSVDDDLETIEGLMAKRIAQDVEAAVKELQSHRSDVLGFGHLVHLRYPATWRRVAERWDEIYPTIPVTVEVRPVIENTGTLTAPFGYPKTKVIK